MKPITDWPNGLVYYDEADIETREFLIRFISRELRDAMRKLNRGIDFVRVETPCLIPQQIAQPHIDAKFPLWQVAWKQDTDALIPEEVTGFYLRPESTHCTYAMFRELYPESLRLKKVLPLCLWQAGLSFRVEQDKTFRNLRFKQFYQMEFQLAYAEGTKADYHAHAVEAMKVILESLFPQFQEKLFPNRDDNASIYSVDLEHEDEIPFYSERTTDLYVLDHEVVAISSRTDFEYPILEISCGLDRLLAIHRQHIS